MEETKSLANISQVLKQDIAGRKEERWAGEVLKLLYEAWDFSQLSQNILLANISGPQKR